MYRVKDRKAKIIVFLFLTAIVVLITVRMVYKSGGLWEEKVLKEQFVYFEKLSSNFPRGMKEAEKEDVEKTIITHTGFPLSLPEGDFQYFSPLKMRAKKIKGTFVPFRYEKEFYLMGVYSLLKNNKKNKKFFLDATTLLSGERDAVSFIVFEGKGRVKISIMSLVSVEELFRITRGYFMEP